MLFRKLPKLAVQLLIIAMQQILLKLNPILKKSLELVLAMITRKIDQDQESEEGREKDANQEIEGQEDRGQERGGGGLRGGGLGLEDLPDRGLETGEGEGLPREVEGQGLLQEVEGKGDAGREVK